MAKKIMICLQSWECLEPHVQDICPQVLGPGNILDCRPADEETYRKVLELAKQHCPSLVRDIEKSKILSEQGS
jgi:hypothetical protein